MDLQWGLCQVYVVVVYNSKPAASDRERSSLIPIDAAVEFRQPSETAVASGFYAEGEVVRGGQVRRHGHAPWGCPQQAVSLSIKEGISSHYL